MDYLTVEEARTAPGLRLVLTAGVPGPWGESAKAILAYKGIEFVPVFQEGGGANEALVAWTGQSSAPVAVLEGQPPVSHWLDLLHLAERLQPEPALIPEDVSARADVLGLSALIAGVDGIVAETFVGNVPIFIAQEPVAGHHLRIHVHLGTRLGGDGLEGAGQVFDENPTGFHQGINVGIATISFVR